MPGISSVIYHFFDVLITLGTSKSGGAATYCGSSILCKCKARFRMGKCRNRKFGTESVGSFREFDVQSSSASRQG
jgi:hypothetical protein